MVCESVNSRISLDWFQHVNYTVSREKTFWFKIFFTFSAERIPFHWFSANHLNIFTFSLKKVYSQIKMGLCVKYLWLRLQLWQERMKRLGDEGADTKFPLNLTLQTTALLIDWPPCRTFSDWPLASFHCKSVIDWLALPVPLSWGQSQRSQNNQYCESSK